MVELNSVISSSPIFDDVTVTGSVTGGSFIVSGTPNYLLDVDSNGVCYLQSQTSGTLSYLGIFSSDSPAQSWTGVDILNYGAPGEATNWSRLWMGFNTTSSKNDIISDAGGDGTVYEMRLYTGSNTSQLVLATDNNISMSGDLAVTGTITGGNLNVSNWDDAYTHSQDNTQAHSDYLLNNDNDITSGTITAAGFTTAGTVSAGAVVPSSDNAVDLGATGNRWRDIYVSRNLTDGSYTCNVYEAYVSFTHSQDNTQAHSDYLLNNANDTTSGELTASKFHAGTLSIAAASITDSSGTISFGDENLTAGQFQTASASWTGDTFTSVISGQFSFGDDNLVTTGTMQAEQLTSTDDITMAGLFTNTPAAGDAVVINIDGDTNARTYAGAAETAMTFNRTLTGDSSAMSNYKLFSSILTYDYNFTGVSGAEDAIVGSYNGVNYTGDYEPSSIFFNGTGYVTTRGVHCQTSFNPGSMTDPALGSFNIKNMGGYFDAITRGTYVFDGAGSHLISSYGGYFIARDLSIDLTGSATFNYYGGYFEANGSADGTSTAYGGYFKASGADTNYGLFVEAGSSVLLDTTIGDGGATNNIAISNTGNMTFNGSAGFYPRFLTQSAEPAAGTGATQCDTSELVVWKDSDDSKVYLCFNDGGTVKTAELT